MFMKHNIDGNMTIFNEQSLVEPGPERIHYSKLPSKQGEVLSYLKEDVRTIYDAFLQGARLSNNGKCLGWRDAASGGYRWQTYNDTIARAKNIGSGLVALGLLPGQDSVLGIYLKNCPEWIMSELAALTYSMVVVALYDTLGAESSQFIMEQTKMKVVVCENDDKVVNLLNIKSPYLKVVITLKEVTEDTKAKAKVLGVAINTLIEVENLGKKQPIPPVPPKPQDLVTICYTSGTTGLPKGVMLTHGNEIAAGDSIIFQAGQYWINKDDVLFSFLPLAHMLERYIEHMAYKEGAAVGFYSGDLQRLSEDIVALKPTVMASVPRMLNKIYNKTITAVSQSKLKNTLFQLAFWMKEKDLKRGIVQKNTVWDKLVLKKVQETLGGSLRLIITASAPISEYVLNFVRCALGCQVIEGYGQTECLVVTTTLYGDTRAGHVGAPGACCKIKLVDVPEMDYYAEKDTGEVCVKGSNVFQGYYKAPEKTKEVFDGNGWLHTGDIGQWLPNGTLKIIDRKKNIFKLSLGEYIAPEKIENIYLRSRFVEQIMVYGESLKSCLVAIVVPNKEALTEWLTDGDIGGASDFDERIKEVVFKDMVRKGNEAGLNSFEQVKDLYIHPELFSAENGLLTPTMKIIRRKVCQKFKHQIDKMYESLE